MDAVKAAPGDPVAFVERCRSAAQRQGFRVENLGQIGTCPLVALTRRTAGKRPRIYVSSGIHGDEPAGALALADLIEQGFFDHRAHWFLVPLLNPTGCKARTRENAQGRDLNRDYRSALSPEVQLHLRWLRLQPAFDAAFCLHEDWEADGFYLYEVRSGPATSIADGVIAAVREHAPIDLHPEIDGFPARGGIIRPELDPVTRELWAEAIYLHVHHTCLTATFETPSAAALEQRVDAHQRALSAALQQLIPSPPPR